MGSEQSDAAVLAARFDNMIRTMHRLGERLNAAEARIYTLELFKHSVLESRTAGEQGKGDCSLCQGTGTMPGSHDVAHLYTNEPTPPPAASGTCSCNRGFYFSVEHDNFYCRKCKHGAGNEFYQANQNSRTEPEFAINSAIAEARPTREEIVTAIKGCHRYGVADYDDIADAILALIDGKGKA